MNPVEANLIAEQVAEGRPFGLIRVGSNAVGRLGEATLLRISADTVGRDHLQAQLDFAGWLADRGFPTSRPLSETIEEIDGYLVTYWQWLDHRHERFNPWQAGRLLRQFHQLSDSYQGQLPAARTDMWLAIGESDYFSLSDSDRRLLDDHYQRLSALAEPTQLDQGVLHGDFTQGNILLGDQGLALIDFDYLSRGPRDLDLIPLLAAGRFYRFSGATSFIIGYGLANSQIDYLSTLVELRGLAATYWAAGLDSDIGRQEAARRIAYWRDPNSHWPAWRNL